MAEPLKLFFSAALVRRLAADVQRAYPVFPAGDFVRQACAGLDKLELMDRSKHDDHPERVLELLELLKDDEAPLVRRSVANNLNDLGKVRPALLVQTCAAWLEGAPDERRALIEHALRSAVKRGQADALHLLGYGKKASVSIERVRVAPPRVPIGERVTISFALRSASHTPQKLLVDVAVHFVKATGKTAPKVFKLTRTTLQPRACVDLRMSVSLAVHTTRKPRPGRHAIDVILNGKAERIGSFEVVAAPSRKKRTR